MSPALGPGNGPCSTGVAGSRPIANDSHQHHHQSIAPGPQPNRHLTAGPPAGHSTSTRTAPLVRGTPHNHAQGPGSGRPRVAVAAAVQGEPQPLQTPELGAGTLPVFVTDNMDSGNIIVEGIHGNVVELKIRMDPFTM
eukprot:scaffold91605_cov36-Prasinocladus_malaysianus.AAC.2